MSGDGGLPAGLIGEDPLLGGVPSGDDSGLLAGVTGEDGLLGGALGGGDGGLLGDMFAGDSPFAALDDSLI